MYLPIIINTNAELVLWLTTVSKLLCLIQNLKRKVNEKNKWFYFDEFTICNFSTKRYLVESIT